MASTRRLVVAVGLPVVCLLAAGTVMHRGSLIVPESERSALRGARAAAHGALEQQEGLVPAGRARDDDLWRAYLGVVQQELQHGHLDAAVRAWQDAYGAALESRRWDSIIAVGDAFVALGRASGSPRGARMNAREAYVTALIRARRDRSVDGALSAAEALRALDDRALAEQCLHIAAGLAAGDDEAQRRVRDTRARWATERAGPGF